MEVIMRIRCTVLAQVILAIGTSCAVVAGPVVAFTTAAAPAGSAVAASVAPNMVVMHG
jgi:hypothetical protein